MAKIFISHSTGDDRFAGQIDLRAAGHEPWTDYLQALPGDSIVTRLDEGLRDCRHMVVIGSPAAVGSTRRSRGHTGG